MAIRYKLTCIDFRGFTSAPCYTRRNLSLAAAHRFADRMCRKFAAKHGGNIRRAPWGVTGGNFCNDYRSAVITVDFS